MASTTDYLPLVLVKARILFLILLLATSTTQAVALSEGVKTGELEQTVLLPIKASLASSRDSLVTSRSEVPVRPTPAVFRTESNIRIITNTGSTTVTTTYTSPGATGSTQAPMRTGGGFTQSQNDWWKAAQEENARFAESSRQTLDEFRAQSQINVEKFKEDSQQKVEEFKKKYGF